MNAAGLSCWACWLKGHTEIRVMYGCFSAVGAFSHIFPPSPDSRRLLGKRLAIIPFANLCGISSKNQALANLKEKCKSPTAAKPYYPPSHYLSIRPPRFVSLFCLSWPFRPAVCWKSCTFTIEVNNLEIPFTRFDPFTEGFGSLFRRPLHFLARIHCL